MSARFRRCFAILLLILGGVVAAPAAFAETTYSFNLPEQALADSLRAIGQQTDMNILFEPDAVRNARSPALRGQYTVDEAIRLVLVGTKLEAQHTAASNVVIKVKSARSSVLPATSADTPGSSGARLAQSNSGSPQSQSAAGPQNTDTSNSTSEASKKEGLEEIIVTGTHIHGVVETGAPTLSITRDQIDQSGYSTLPQVVSTLPQNFNGFTPLGSFSSGPSGNITANNQEVTSIDLRGLGPQSTLTLVDGRRVAGAIQGQVVDISLIPLAMVDHVDITTGGSSAIYGADAVGGVANVVLRHTYEGAETGAFYSDGIHGAGRLEFDQVAGHQFGWGGFIIGYEFSRNSSLNLLNTGLVQPISDTGNEYLVFREPAANWQHSVNFGGQFTPSDRLEFYADASYSHKKLESFSDELQSGGTFDYQSLNSQAATQFGATLGSRFKWASDWTLDVSGSGSVFEFRCDCSTESGPVGSLPSPTDLSYYDRSTLYSFSAIADGTVLSIDGHDIKSALGAEYRRESLNITLPSTSFGATPISDAKRNISSAFAELHVPLASTPDNKYSGYYNLELSAAARYDHYSDFGHSFNPQFGLVWSPIVDLSFRGTYARAFRAPELIDLKLPGQSLLAPFPFITPSNPAGTNFPTLSLFGGNPTLGPETARTWTGGLDYKIHWKTTTTTLSGSFFDINYRDRITQPIQGGPPYNPALYPSSILDLNPTTSRLVSLLSQAPFIPGGNFVPGSTWDGNPNTLLAQVPGVVVFDDRFNNVAAEAISGLDLSVSTQLDTQFGRGDFGLNATRTFHHHYNISAESPEISLLNQVGLPTATKLRGNAGWTRGGLSGFIFVNYVGSYSNELTTPVSSISSWTTFDMTLMLDTSRYASQGAWSNIKVSLAAQNIFNRDPPRFEQSTYGFLFDSANANPFGRVLSLRATKKW
jgi:iron complex outermembrane receptor protein